MAMRSHYPDSMGKKQKPRIKGKKKSSSKKQKPLKKKKKVKGVY